MSEANFVVGMGQLGSLLSRAMVESAEAVIPITRHNWEAFERLENGDATLVAVGEDALEAALSSLPVAARSRVTLLQNELRPDQWVGTLETPTLLIVWFEKKGDKSPVDIRPSVVMGPDAAAWQTRLLRLGLPCDEVPSEDLNEVAHQLILKNLYILGLNIGGLSTRDPKAKAGQLLGEYSEVFNDLVAELLRVESAIFSSVWPDVSFDKIRLQNELALAIRADENHSCAGRSAPRRLERTVRLSREYEVSVPMLEGLASEFL